MLEDRHLADLQLVGELLHGGGIAMLAAKVTDEGKYLQLPRGQDRARHG